MQTFVFFFSCLDLIKMSLSFAAQGLSIVSKGPYFHFGHFLFQVKIFTFVSCACNGSNTYFADSCVRENCPHYCDTHLTFTDYIHRCRCLSGARRLSIDFHSGDPYFELFGSENKAHDRTKQ